MRSPIAAIVLCALFAAAAAAHAEDIVTLPTRDGVTQSFLLVVNADGKPAAAAILFPGGTGSIKLRIEEGKPAFSSDNFLVRSRGEFARNGIVVAVVDAPSDQPAGMSDGFRVGADHSRDIGVVVSDLKKRYPGIAVFLIGTSRGTVSAAYAGRALGTEVAGVVLTASVYRASGGRRGQAGLSGFDFADLKQPVLLAHHYDDGCNTTPYSDAKKLADRYPLISVKGGKPAVSPPCDALSEHGFLGKEAETIDAIANWMLKKPFAREIN